MGGRVDKAEDFLRTATQHVVELTSAEAFEDDESTGMAREQGREVS